MFEFSTENTTMLNLFVQKKNNANSFKRKFCHLSSYQTRVINLYGCMIMILIDTKKI